MKSFYLFLSLFICTATVFSIESKSKDINELIGAKAAISTIRNAFSQVNDSSKDQNSELKKLEEIAQRIGDHYQQRETLTAEAQADEWLSIFDEYLNLDRESEYFEFRSNRNFYDPLQGNGSQVRALEVSTSLFVSILPDPDSWEYLNDAFQSTSDWAIKHPKQATGFRIIMKLLGGQLDEVDADIETLATIVATEQKEEYNFYSGTA